MTQLDIPPISFARYLDLLKRRRWHVIPISLLGLIVGAAVAFFIPRYYVAGTIIKYSGSVLEQQGTLEDPMIGVVQQASLTIPAMIPEALEQLRWPEYINADAEGKRAFVAAVRSEYLVQDLNVTTRGRQYASLRISYRDTNPDRVAAFPNTLRDVWIKNRENSLRARADLERGNLTKRLQIEKLNLDNTRTELRRYQEQYNINPALAENGQRSESSLLSERISDANKRILELESQARSLQSQVDQYTARLATLPKRIPDPTRANQVLLQQIQVATQKALRASASLRGITEAHTNHSARTRELEEARAELAELEARRVAESQRQGNLVDNPAYATINADQVLAEGNLLRVKEQLTVERENLSSLQQRLAQLPAIWEGYQARLSRIETAEATVNELVAQQNAQQLAYERIHLQEPIEVLQPAVRPPRPTEPNITLLSLAGSAVGLGAAIALILLIDVARTTFKTVDDVERTLNIPVLGSMAHLETQEQRQETSSKRRSAALLAGAFLVLLVTTVTIYYTDDTRLPDFARELLEVLLPKSTS